MLTRRKAFYALPAGLMLDASFVTSAQAQAQTQSARAGVPGFLRVDPKTRLNLILARPKRPDVPGEPSPRSLNEFVRICREVLPERMRRDFGSELIVTTQILQFLAVIFDEKFPSNIESKQEFSEFTTKTIGMTKAVHSFLDRYLDRERREDSGDRFIRRYKEQEKLWFENWEREVGRRDETANLDKLRNLPEEICEYLLTVDERFKNTPIRLSGNRRLSPPISVYQILLMSESDLAIPENSPIRNRIVPEYRKALYPKAVELLQAGMALSFRRHREFHAAAFAYAIYHFVWRLLDDPSNQDHILHARTRSMGRLVAAYSFFDDVLFDLLGQSLMLRRQINNLPREAYMGSQTEVRHIWDQPPPVNTNPVNRVLVGTDIYFTNYYLTLRTERLPSDANDNVPPFDILKGDEREPPYKFSSRRFSFERSKIESSQPTAEIDKKRLNERGAAALRDRFPGSDRNNQNRPPSFPPRNNTDQATYNTFLPIIIDTLNKEISEIEDEYRDVQLEFNCMEIMTAGLLSMLAIG